MNKQRVIIIGSDSFIGLNLSSFLKENFEVICISRNLNNSSSHIQVASYETCLCDLNLKNDIIINCVYNQDNFDYNIQLVDHIYNIYNDRNIRKFIFISTAVVVGNVCDDFITEDTLCKPNSDYELQKFAIEEYIKTKHNNDFEVIIIRPTAIFGPGGKNLNKFIDLELFGNPILNYLRAFIYGKRKLHLIPIELFNSQIFFLINRQVSNLLSYNIISLDTDIDNNFNAIITIIRRYLKRNHVFQICLPIFFTKLIFKICNRESFDISRIYISNLDNPINFTIRNSIENYLKLYIK